MIGLFLGLGLAWVSILAGIRLLKLSSLSYTIHEKRLFGFAMGLLLLAYGVLGLGLIGHLTSQWIAALAIGIYFFGVNQRRQIYSASSENSEKTEIFHRKPFWVLCFLLTIAALTAALAGVLAPEIANDSLCYHLHIPKIFLTHASISKIPYEINSLFPFFMEMLDTIGIAWGHISLAKTLHALTALGAGYAVYALSRKIASVQASLLAAILFTTTPGLVNQMGTTYVDISLAFFTALAVYAYLRLYETQRPAWAVLSGIMMGICLSIKFLALISSVAIVMLMFFDGIFSKRKHFLKSILFFMGAAFLVCGYWYIRSWIEWGNPVYPYFYQIFKSGYFIHYTDIGVQKTAVNFLLLPWKITMHPQVFEGFGDNIGPFYLAFLPVGGMALMRNPLLKRISFFTFIYLIFWFLLGQSLRFFFPALPALAVLCAAGFGRMERFKNPLAKKGLFAIALIILTLHAGLAVYHYRKMIKVSMGLETHEDYLRRTERSFKMAEYVNQNLPKNAKILNSVEVRMFYFNREIVREDVYFDVTQYAAEAASETEVLDRLKGDGFTHYLSLQTPDFDVSKMSPLRLPRIYSNREKSLAHSGAPLYTYTFTDDDNPPMTYNLYQL